MDGASQDSGVTPDELARARALWAAGDFAAAEQVLHRPAAAAANLEALALLGHVQLQLGKVAAAHATYEQAAAVAPDAAPTQRALARLHQRHGRTADALAAARRAHDADPATLENAVVLAACLSAAGQSGEAEALARDALIEDPELAEGYVVLAQTAARNSRTAEAAAACEAALALRPHLPLWTFLGSLRTALDDLPGVEDAYGKALEQRPDDLAALLSLATLERHAGRAEQAEALIRRALTLAPDNAGAWMTLGAALQQQSRMPEAEAAYRRSLSLNPGLAAVHINLAVVLIDRGEPEKALAEAGLAVGLRPDLAVAHVGRAAALQSLGRTRDAEDAYRAALKADPVFVGAMTPLAELLSEGGDEDGAQRLFRQALALEPSLDLSFRTRLRLPVINTSGDQIDGAREGYGRAIAEISETPGRFAQPDRLGSSWFYLPYHGRDDRALMEGLDRMFSAKAPELSAISPQLAGWRPPAARGERARIGVVSQFLSDHTIGLLFAGLVAGLDRSRFEVVVGHLPKAAMDPQRKAISAAADVALDLPADLDRQRSQISDQRLDVLIYPDVGMTMASYLLARARLAPVQVTTWGHPNTTGLRSLDYFLSSEALEPEGGEAHYTEGLVRMSRLPCAYAPPSAPPRRSRAQLGLPEAGRLYGCPQTLFKLHPDFDPVLATIVAADPEAWLVFLAAGPPAWTEILRRRWSAYPGLNDRVVFAPHRPREEFLAMMAAFDVLLDPPHFGSGNTFYEAAALGVPIVTWPGAFARGRVVAAGYAQLGLADAPIVADLEAYAPVAVALATDRGGREDLARRIRSSAQRNLFNDARALRDIEAFFDAALDAAGHGRVLARGACISAEGAA